MKRVLLLRSAPRLRREQCPNKYADKLPGDSGNMQIAAMNSGQHRVCLLAKRGSGRWPISPLLLSSGLGAGVHALFTSFQNLEPAYAAVKASLSKPGVEAA